MPSEFRTLASYPRKTMITPLNLKGFPNFGPLNSFRKKKKNTDDYHLINLECLPNFGPLNSYPTKKKKKRCLLTWNAFRDRFMFSKQFPLFPLALFAEKEPMTADILVDYTYDGTT